MPVKILEEDLSISPSLFFKQHHRKKPYFDDAIIFTCRVGIRSKRAAETAQNMGYEKYNEFNNEKKKEEIYYSTLIVA
jgi:rhodanese-related sulfurtransferase